MMLAARQNPAAKNKSPAYCIDQKAYFLQFKQALSPLFFTEFHVQNLRSPQQNLTKTRYFQALNRF